MIYLITNKETGDTYVGYTSKSLNERFKSHQYAANSGSKTYLHKAMRKYGIDSFTIEKIADGSYNEEIEWIEKLLPSYNLTKGGEGGDTSNSPNFRQAMIVYHSKKHIDEYATFGMLGKKHTSETKEKQSQARKKYWDSINDEERRSRSKKLSGPNNGMYGKTPKNSIQVVYDGVQYKSIAEAARKTGKSTGFIKKHGTLL
jgi:group I intron endonuclease